MKSPITIRTMTPSDLDFADSLRALAGWNQLPADWRRFLAYEPDGCFVAEWEGNPAGTATTTCYGGELAWIGMVLVHPDARRRGIGKALLRHCMDYLRSIPCVKLDATPLGKPLYEQLGFVEELGLRRWEGKGPASQDPAVQDLFQPWDEPLLPALAAFDQKAFGTLRERLLKALASGSSETAVCLAPDGNIKGYGLLRAGARASYLGPIVAAEAALGCRLATTLLSRASGQNIFWDIPDANIAAVELAQRLGFTPQRNLLRMFRGKNTCPGNPLLQFAIADPAIG